MSEFVIELPIHTFKYCHDPNMPKQVIVIQLKAKDMDISSGGSYIATMQEQDAALFDLHHGDRVKISRRGRSVIAVLNIAEGRKAVSPGSIGLFEEIIRDLRVRDGQHVSISLVKKPDSVYFIKRKMDGFILSPKEIDAIIQDVVENRLSSIELAYFVAASYMNVFTFRETVALTRSLISHGKTIHFNRYPVVDKHCTGGVAGNRTTMVIVPILAAAGLTVPKTSSRSITSPAGTADVMEVLADVSLSIPRIRQVVRKTNACMVWGGALGLAPADDRIIQVEHPLSIDAKSQLISSILAKKKSVSATHLLVDIPIGKNAKVVSRKHAYDLKRLFTRICRLLGIKVKVIITDGSQPIGNGLGPALEARDVLWLLQNDSRAPQDLKKKSLGMAGMLLEMAGKCRPGKGRQRAAEILESGKAYQKMMEIIRAQGARIVHADQIPLAPFRWQYRSPVSGRIRELHNKILSKTARIAGAPQDKGAGIYLEKHVGDAVKKGERIFTLYSNSRQRLQYAVEFFRKFNQVAVR